MTIKELIDYLSQFDPEKKVWVIYDSGDLFEPCFQPTSRNYIKNHTMLDREDREQVATGDLLMEVG